MRNHNDNYYSSIDFIDFTIKLTSSLNRYIDLE